MLLMLFKTLGGAGGGVAYYLRWRTIRGDEENGEDDYIRRYA